MSLVESVYRSEPQRFGVWPSVGKLLRLRVRIWWNAFRRAKLRSKIGTAVVAFLLVGLMVFLFFASSALLRFMRSPRLAEYIDPAQFMGAIPTIVLTMAFFLVIMTNFGLLLQALYLSRDMDFLITSPIPMRAVFLAKLLEAILPNFALFCAFSLPVLFGLGFSSGYSLLYYPLLLAMLLLLALAAGGMAGLLVMGVVRVAPAKRVAEVLGVLGAIVTVLCGQLGNIMNAANIKGADVGGALTFFARLNSPWSPLAWAGRGLTAIGQGQWLPGLGLSVLSLALAAGLFAGALTLAEQLYYSGWSSMQGTAVRRRNHAARPARVAGLAPQSVPGAAQPTRERRLISAPLRGMIVKDFLILRRDPRNLSQVITPLILGVVMIFSTRGGEREASRALTGSGLANLDVYAMLALALFVGWMLMTNLATMAFSREGRNYWMLKAAPIRPVYLIASKFVVSYLPSIIFSLGYMLLAYPIRGMNYASFPYGALIVALVMAGATGISLAFGIAGANLEWDSPQRQRLRGSTGCVALIIVSLYMLVDLVLFLAPPILWQVISGETPLLATLLGLVLGGVAAVLCVVLPLAAAQPRLAKIGEA